MRLCWKPQTRVDKSNFGGRGIQTRRIIDTEQRGEKTLDI